MSDSSTRSQHDLETLRVEYAQRDLTEDQVNPDPIAQLAVWLDEAVAAQDPQPNAMTLATCHGGRPSARVVLLKQINAEGLVFFTNYQSRKAEDLAANPRAAAVFWWPTLQRQARVEGTVTRTSVQESQEYFNRRPLASRLGAVASPQSRVIGSRQELDRRVQELAARYADGQVPCPADWGGYRLRPQTVELWQGRAMRLHDRIEYSWNDAAGWVIRRLAP
jgi:pyridoxamine 5'-phosphate oxidase